MAKKIKQGEKLPRFKLQNQEGEIIDSQDLLGKKYILFFYPRDNSPSCTKEACSLRDDYKKLQKKSYEVFGISPDSMKKHMNFIEKFSLPFDLLVDQDLKFTKACGLYGKKQFMGKEIMGVYRSTLLIDEKGFVEVMIEKVITKEHGKQVLELIP